MKIETLKTKDLIPYANNAKKHSDEQIAKLAKSMATFGFTNPILIANDNSVIAGHARLLAAQSAGITSVPCIRLTKLTDTERRAYILADNRLSEIGGGWDVDMLRREMEAIKSLEFDTSMLGFGDFDAFVSEAGEEVEKEIYTRKLVSPHYEVKGKKPKPAELYDSGKADTLVEEIKAAKLGADVKEFLIRAAGRHVVFDYEEVAEYYAHAPKAVQELMEKSALVIVDFDKAVEHGFVKVTEALSELYTEDYPDAQ